MHSDEEEIDYVTKEEFEKVVKGLLKRIKALEGRVSELEVSQNENNEPEQSQKLANMRFKFSTSEKI